MKSIPIMISLTRWLMLPIITWQIMLGSDGLAAGLLILSGSFAFILSLISERIYIVSGIDKILDMVADKLTRAFVCILVAFRVPECWWLLAVVLGRDLVMLALGGYLLINNEEDNAAKWIDRGSGLLFYVGMAVLLMHLYWPSLWIRAALAAVVASEIASAFCYLPAAVRQMRRRYRAFAARLRPKHVQSSERGIKAYGIFAIGVIPLCTIAFAAMGDPLTVNLSIIGNQPGHRAWFILWGALCAGFFLSLFRKTFKLAGYHGKIEWALMIMACISFVACVLTPFLPERFPRMADWHNRLAVTAPLLIIVASLLLTLRLRKVDRRLYQEAMLSWLAITVLAIILMRATGISGLFETVLIISVSLHTYHILIRLEKLQGWRLHHAEINSGSEVI